MRVLTSILLIVLLCASVLAENLVLVNGSVIDGTGKPRVLANVRIRDGKIADIGPFKPTTGEVTLDLKGMIVTPGFIDLQSLSPTSLQNPEKTSQLMMQGITTAVLGSDGSGPYSVEDFMLPFDEKPPAINIAMVVGHATVRRQIMGPDYKRTATTEEVRKMGELVSDAMKQGAFGMASDLQQEPASFSSPDELMALAKTTATLGGSLLIKLRNENDKVLEAVREVIGVARDAKLPVQVFTVNKAALSEIDKARAQRIDVAAESYSFAQFTADKTMTLERAVQRLSATAASRVSLRERGVLKKGVPADMVVVNAQAVPAAIKYVFVNGTMILKDGQMTDARAGQALR